MHLLDKQNDIKFEILFPGEKNKLSAVSASGVSKMLVLRIFYVPHWQIIYLFLRKTLNLVFPSGTD